MAITFEPWVSETGTLTGTDPTYTVPNSATTGSGNQYLRTIGAAFASATDIVLSIASASPNQAEMSVWSFTPGTGGAAGTITRTQLIKSSTGSAINWSGVTCTIECTEPLPTQTSAGATSAGLLGAFGSNGNLDLSTLPPFGCGKLVSGRWYGAVGSSYSSAAPGAGYMSFMPVFVPGPFSPQAIGIYVTTAPTANTTFRVGFYKDNGATVASAPLLYDAGSLTVASGSTGAQTLSISGQTIDPGDGRIVWLALLSPAAINGIVLATNANPSNGYLGAWFVGMPSVANGGNSKFQFGMSVAQSFGALPATAPSNSFFSINSSIPSVEFQA